MRLIAFFKLLARDISWSRRRNIRCQQHTDVQTDKLLAYLNSW